MSGNALTTLVHVKWGKEMLKDVEIDPTECGLVFKSQLYALTSVPVDKQKVMIKGKTVKDDMDMATLKLTAGATFMMMGTAEGKEL